MQKLSKKFVPHIHVEFSDQGDFENLLNQMGSSNVKEGMVAKGQVIKIEGNHGRQIVVVDVGLGAEGRIPQDEFVELPSEGDIVEVYVNKIEGRGGRTILSRKQAIIEKLWEELVAVWQKGENIEGVITERVKGGFVVQIGKHGEITAFLPGSQVDVRPVKDISSIMNISQPFKIVKMSKKESNIVVSRKDILEESRAEARKEMLSSIKEGMILEGAVKNITNYGAFIDLGSLDGLLHLSDMSWSRINHPSEMLTVGQKIKVVVTKFNEETNRISLGLRQLDDNPWQNIKDEFPIGQKMVGKITNCTDYGVFIELRDGIEGLVHSSEISWIKANQNPKKSLTIGQEVEFVILEVDTQKHRISLSIKQCQENPLIKFAENNLPGTIVKGQIKNINEYGIAVNLEDNIDGFIHESDVARGIKNSSEVLKQYKKGEEIECNIISVEVDKERVKLGIVDDHEDAGDGSSLDEFKKNSIVSCKITAVNNDGIEVEILNSKQEVMAGFIKKNELASEKIEQRPEKFHVGDTMEAKVSGIDKKSNIILLSIRVLEQEVHARAVKDYGMKDSSSSLGDILGDAMEEEKKKR
jgi:small subunit ribosomal protein S1